MGEVRTIGLDLAKHVFQVHGVDAEGATVLRKQLRRAQVLAFFSRLPRCLVGMEACGTAHYWARELRALGHEVRLMPAQYVKAYLKRNKNDAADAAAICEAVVRPTMRFVAVKTAEQQAENAGSCRRGAVAHQDDCRRLAHHVGGRPGVRLPPDLFPPAILSLTVHAVALPAFHPAANRVAIRSERTRIVTAATSLGLSSKDGSNRTY